MNAQNLTKAALTAFFKKNGIDVITSRNYHTDGVELHAYPDLQWPEIDIEMNTTSHSEAQTSTEAKAMLAVKVVKLLHENGIQPYMVTDLDPRSSYREYTSIFVSMNGTAPRGLDRYMKVWPESIENLMVKRISKRVAEERKWIADEKQRKADEKAAREAEAARRLAAFWDLNGPTVEPFATILDMPNHKTLVYKTQGKDHEMVMLVDCVLAKSWMDDSPEWNVSCGHLDLYNTDRSNGVGSTSTRGRTIIDCVVEFSIAWGNY